jgi:hypothetical protein
MRQYGSSPEPAACHCDRRVAIKGRLLIISYLLGLLILEVSREKNIGGRIPAVANNESGSELQG